MCRSALRGHVPKSELRPEALRGRLVVVWETTDPEGRHVVLTFGRWRHILDKHGGLVAQRSAVIEAVAHPHERLPGRKPNEEWFYGRAAAPKPVDQGRRTL